MCAPVISWPREATCLWRGEAGYAFPICRSIQISSWGLRGLPGFITSPVFLLAGGLFQVRGTGPLSNVSWNFAPFSGGKLLFPLRRFPRGRGRAWQKEHEKRRFVLRQTKAFPASRHDSGEPCGCSLRRRNALGTPALCLTDRNPELVGISRGTQVQNCPGFLV